MKLRTRITLSMLVTSLLALGLVGVVADQRLMSQFNQDFAQASTRNFRADVTAYIAKWGSWDAAHAHGPSGRSEPRPSSLDLVRSREGARHQLLGR